MLTYTTLIFGDTWPLGDPNAHMAERYAAWLFNQVDIHAARDARFMLFTDKERVLPVTARPIQQVIIPDYGYHIRLGMFDQRYIPEGRVISLDLDTVILRNLKPLEATPIPREAPVVPLKPPGYGVRPGCGVMVWDQEATTVREMHEIHKSSPRSGQSNRELTHPKLPHPWVRMQPTYRNKVMTDEDFIWPFVVQNDTGWFYSMNDLVPGFVVSRRALRAPQYKPDAGMVYWHGFPKPHSEDFTWLPKLPVP